MEWTGLNELREKYLSFFESKGHLRLPSFPLIPQGDNSLLLINAGMAPMKKYFTGELTPPSKRVTTCQKCIRTPDIERVGKTSRHGTYFEMLGNFSFGDYFKKEATAWAWEFCTKVLELPIDKLYVSVYLDDDEAFDIWTKDVGVSPDHMVRLGKEDNFWEHGAGPCGPCSEIYFDRGPEHGCGSPDCKVGCDCDRFVEFWNVVFTQFENDGNNNYTPLEHPNIDTGMGIERLACICQGVDNLFEVDTVRNIMKKIIEISGVEYHQSDKSDVSLRVITDHIRSTTFMIGDGVMPSNEGRGYVLRRLLRRAARHGRLIGIKDAFLAEAAKTVISENANAYPELVDKQDYILKVISIEEENFNKTIDSGLKLLNDMIEKSSDSCLSGEDAFKLSDTFGFPLDLTKEILEEKGMTVDEDKFFELVQNQRTTARNARKDAGADAWKNSSTALSDIAPTEFVGYTENTAEARIKAIIVDGERAEAVSGPVTASIILDTSPFYAESGGQVGDTGVINIGSTSLVVKGTTKNHEGIFIHKVEIPDSASLKIDDCVTASIDADARQAIMRNHTATHLLQAALRSVLGSHVQQAGSYVSASEARFDFSHFSALSTDEIEQIEALVNKQILMGLNVTVNEMSIDDAKKSGAMALFGEKYGDVVRVVKAGEFSTELCGGTHIDNTAKIGLFKIVSEASVAAGIRRITAVTGLGVMKYIAERNSLIYDTAAAMKLTNLQDIAAKAASLCNDIKSLEKENEVLKNEIASAKAASLLKATVNINGFEVLAANIGEALPNDIRTMADNAKKDNDNIIALFAGFSSGKLSFCCSCGKEAVAKGAHAGKIVKEIAAIAGGSGGGKPDSAMAGGKDVSKIDEALNALTSIVEKI